MANLNYNQVNNIIQNNRDVFDFEIEGIEVDKVAKAEDALEIKMPPSYREFLLHYGNGGVGFLEIYGLTKNSSDDFSVGKIPNGIWLTLNERKQSGLPHRFIIIGSTGDGYWYALDSSQPDKDGEYPVGICGFGENNEGFEKTNDNFAEYLFEQVTLALEDQD